MLLYFVLSAPAGFGASTVGLNVYGLSRHLNVQRGMKLNERNFGIGLRASFGMGKKPILFFLEGGTFNDSFENQARYLSIGIQSRLVYQLRLGLHAAIYRSKSVNFGDPFFAPVPLISYTVGPVTLNGVYFPKVEATNSWHTIAAYLTIHVFWHEQRGRIR